MIPFVEPSASTTVADPPPPPPPELTTAPTLSTYRFTAYADGNFIFEFPSALMSKDLFVALSFSSIRFDK